MDELEPRDGAVWRRIDGPRRPPWSRISSAGTTQVEEGGIFQRHHHDCDEYWLIYEGHGIAEVDGRIYEFGPGDMVCTETGKTHDVLAADGVIRMFWFEQEVFPGGVVGHRFSDPADVAGHRVMGIAEWRASAAATEREGR